MKRCVDECAWLGDNGVSTWLRGVVCGSVQDVHILRSFWRCIFVCSLIDTGDDVGGGGTRGRAAAA